ncbi:MAG TPA: non-reducing end alpha-L-arabinofuranosidase family hydrolase [Tepidisphaeraceae bacterium]|nr:non-reducing end alpha-L-arabinofuranosidase family hydrolase [Tepidisphaeraceae bacterium]
MSKLRTGLFLKCAAAAVFLLGLVNTSVGDEPQSATSTAPPAHSPSTQPVLDARLRPPFHWVSTGPLLSAKADPQRQVVSIKDPSIVRYNDRWHIYATYATHTGRWGMLYTSFADWKDAATAPQYFMDDNPNLRGYHCAPQVFYFAPQQLWYLVYQSQHPTYSTTTDVSKPESWSAPRSFFDGTPRSVVQGWLDYWVICDDTHAYLFFTDDHGRFYRSRTALADFPNGFDEPVVVMHEPVARELFEGGATYRIKGTNLCLTLIEAANPQWKRYYKAFIADRLDGSWRPLAAEWGNSFADATRVRTQDGSRLWTEDISHGELLRDGYDQTMTIDPDNLVLLYQGLSPNRPAGLTYVQLPWQLGLLRLESNAKQTRR